MLDTLDAAAVRRWCASGLAALRRHQGEIDDLNVYPVPDGDTGTNLVLTLTSAQQALAMDLDTLPDDGPHRARARAAADGPGRAARRPGQLRGDPLADPARLRRRARPPRRRSRGRAARRRAGATRPPPRTRRWPGRSRAPCSAWSPPRPRAAEQADSDDLRAVVRAAAGGAARALARTPEQLPALARAGVVDAGGRGLCVLLDALVEVVTGESPPRPAPAPRRGPPAGHRRPRDRLPGVRVRGAVPARRPGRGGGPAARRRWTRWATRWWSSATA